VRVRVLGSAAGGGFPQWNCNCDNCRGIRSGTVRARPRTQASLAVSSDGERWCLLNAGPDLRTQILSWAALAPRSGPRDAPIDALLLTDAEIDHTAGLLSLRETRPLRIYSTARVFDWVFKSNPVFASLINPEKLNWTAMTDGGRDPIVTVDGDAIGLGYEARFVRGKVPTYVRPAPADIDGSNLACRIIDSKSGASILYVPAIRELDDAVIAAAAACDILFFDGSFWSETEMESRGVGTRTASAMGHLPIGGPDGSLARLRGLTGVRKIYTHINNTNPILDEDSPERRALTDARWEVAEDGMELVV
jgi:pyrroloquinoline quinone biosynthesis protein B